MDQVRLEAVDRFGDGGSRKRQLEFGIERQWHRRNADQASSHVVLWASLRTEHDHLITGFNQVLHRFGETGDDPIDLGEEGLGEEGDFQG